MFENGSFLRRRKRFKLPKIDKEFLQKTLGPSFNSSPSPIPSPSATTPPISVSSHNSAGNGLTMNMSPPIPGMITNPAFLPSQFSHPQFGAMSSFGHNGAHPMFNNLADARLIAAAAAAGYPSYGPPHHHHPHHHHHHHGMHPGLHPGHPGMGISPKDFDDIREATRAIRSIQSNNGKPMQRVVVKPPSDMDLSPPIKSQQLSRPIHPHLTEIDKPKDKTSPLLSSSNKSNKRKGGNSNNFSIENLIAKDKDRRKEQSQMGEELNNNEDKTGKVSEEVEEDEDIVMDEEDDEEELGVPSIVSSSSSSERRPERDLDEVSSRSTSPVVSSRKTSIVSPSHSPSGGNSGLGGGSRLSPSVTAANLLPSYPFYAAAFLSAQSLLYNQQYFGAGGGGGGGGPPGNYTFSNHPGMNIPNSAAAMLFSGKNFSGL